MPLVLYDANAFVKSILMNAVQHAIKGFSSEGTISGSDNRGYDKYQRRYNRYRLSEASLGNVADLGCHW